MSHVHGENREDDLDRGFTVSQLEVAAIRPVDAVLVRAGRIVVLPDASVLRPAALVLAASARVVDGRRRIVYDVVIVICEGRTSKSD